MKLLVIGNGAGGATAAFEARKFDEDANITIISRDKYTHYSPCGLPFAVSGRVKNVLDLIVYPPSLYRMSGIELLLETNVTEINPSEHKVITETQEFEYDKLIIAAGSSPIVPSIKGVDKKGVYTLKGIDDGINICKAVKNAKKAVVLGAGLVGLEISAAFNELGLEVIVIEKLDLLIPRLLDCDISEILKQHLENKGIEFKLNSEIIEVTGDDNIEGIIFRDEKNNKKEISCDIALIACGMKPEISLAEKSGIEIGSLGGIKANEKMETSVKDIYAAGDCVESNHIIINAPTLSMLGSTAVRQGKVAGVNACSGNMKFFGTLNTTITDIGGMKIGVLGINSNTARKHGIECASSAFNGLTKDSFFPGGKNLTLKLLGNKKTGQVTGAQIIGEEGVFSRILALSFAMQSKINAYDLSIAETTYVPSISPTFDPITLAAEMLVRRMND